MFASSASARWTTAMAIAFPAYLVSGVSSAPNLMSRLSAMAMESSGRRAGVSTDSKKSRTSSKCVFG